MYGRLRAARVFAGLEQTEMAAELGVSRGSVGNWETGKNEMPARAMIRWAEMTRVSLDWIAWGTQKAPLESGASGIVRPEGFEPPAY